MHSCSIYLGPLGVLDLDNNSFITLDVNLSRLVSALSETFLKLS